MSEYNYATFPLDMETATFERFRRAPAAGERAPDGELTDASDGATVRLSDYWRRGPTVVEFGSLT